MASVMADSLASMAKRRKVKALDVPQGVYNDAVRFFNLVTEAAGKAVPKNPPASVNAYAIAANLVSRCADGTHSRTEIGQRLNQYSTLVKRLAMPGNLTAAEVQTANLLREFFICLKDVGEAEAYDTSGHFQMSQNQTRFF